MLFLLRIWLQLSRHPAQQHFSCSGIQCALQARGHDQENLQNAIQSLNVHVHHYSNLKTSIEKQVLICRWIRCTQSWLQGRVGQQCQDMYSFGLAWVIGLWNFMSRPSEGLYQLSASPAYTGHKGHTKDKLSASTSDTAGPQPFNRKVENFTRSVKLFWFESNLGEFQGQKTPTYGVQYTTRQRCRKQSRQHWKKCSAKTLVLAARHNRQTIVARLQFFSSITLLSLWLASEFL